MAIEETQGLQAPAVTSAETTPTIMTAQPPLAEQTPTPPPVPAGRSVDELSNEIAELRRQNDEIADRAARAEHEASYTRNLIETFRQGQARPTEQVPDVPQITDDEFLTNPAKATTRLIEAQFARERADRDKRDREQYVERAKSLYESGKKSAFEKGGKLYSGIEREVADEIQRGVISGAIQPDSVTDPNLWAVTAMAIRYTTRGERSFDKYFSDKPTPMAPAHQETPTPSGPPQVKTTLTETELAWASYLGGDAEKWAAAKAKGK